jgi:dTDP-4-amino-4,6-dideoxygalactose transaminase
MSPIQTKVPLLDLKPQYNSIKTEIHDAIDRVLESGAFIMGPDVKLFEEEAARYLGVKHAIGVNSGTDALVIGLRALGLGAGDEVITTPFSFFATAESISNVGAKPVFVDIDAESFNIDPRLIEAAITPKTKAIMPVHLYGRAANMTAIMEIAAKHGLKVVEDCAQSFGARYMGDCNSCADSCSDTLRASLTGKQTGTMGDVGAYSFFPSKNLGAYGDGGLIVTNDDGIAELARMLRTHGSRKKYHNELLGYNSRLDTLQAAILRVKLPYIDKWNEGRRRVAQTYRELLGSVSGIITPEVVGGHVFHQYTIRVLGGKRDELAKALNDVGIGTMIYYPIPQDRLPVYLGQYPVLAVSESLTGEVLSLPIWPELDAEVQDRVVKALSVAFG